MDRYSEEFSVDARANDNLVPNFTAGTVLEQNLLKGYDRTSLPVGMGNAQDEIWDGTAGRGTKDYIAAVELGTQGKKR